MSRDAGRGRWRARWAGMAAVALLAGGALASAPAAVVDDVLAPLIAARDRGRLGHVEALVVADPAAPADPPTPVPGVTVALLPWAPDIDARLEAVKARSRDSGERFVASAADVRAVLTTWVDQVKAAGGGDLVHHAMTDAAGVARLERVPAGDWLLVALRTALTRTATPDRARRRDGGGYVPSPETTGYNLVTYWRRRVAVTPEETLPVQLTERGVWLAAAERIVKPGVPPPVGVGSRKHR